MSVADRARAAALSVEVKKHGLRQAQDGTWTLSFTVAPLDMPQALALAPPGARFVAALVQIGDNEEPIPPAEQTRPKNEAASERARADFALKPKREQAVAKAGILCGDPIFQDWIIERSPRHQIPAEMDTPAKIAAFLLRKAIGIDSRSQIGTEQAAYTAFIRLESDFREANGQAAERRG